MVAFSLGKDGVSLAAVRLDSFLGSSGWLPCITLTGSAESNIFCLASS